MPRTCKLLSIHQCQELANCCSFTSTTILRLFQFSNAQNFQTAINPQTAVNSQVPQSCKLFQFSNAQNFQTAINSQVSKVCKLIYFASAKNLQNAIHSQMPRACKLLSVHKCQNLANCHQFTNTKILQTAVNSQVTAVNSEVLRPCKLLPIHTITPQHKSKVCNLNHPPENCSHVTGHGISKQLIFLVAANSPCEQVENSPHLAPTLQGELPNALPTSQISST